ncbi:glutamine amidotransferase-related protein [Streptococcus dentiloxodontae]
MRVHFIIHEVFEAPGAYLAWAAMKGHEIGITKVYQYEKLPQAADFDMLIVMGGPQSPSSTKSDFPYYDAQAEIAFIQKAVEAGKYVIGACLGAQLIGQAFGAAFEHSPEREIGNFPIYLTEAGLADKNLAHFGQELTVGHWHGDMPGLTKDAQVLATSQGCPRQIIKYADKVYAFQCHLEFSKSLTAALLAEEADYNQQAAEQQYYQPAQTILDCDYAQMNQALFEFLDKFTQIEGTL